MATYEDFIGSGTANADTSASYATVQLWYTGRKSGTYVDGDIIVGKLQNANDGHSGTHDISMQIFGGGADVWPANNLTIVVSGTNPDRSNWSNPSCTFGSNISYLKANSSDKTYKYENLDLIVDNNVGLRPGNGSTSANTGDSLVIEFNNCRVYSSRTGTNQYIVRNLHDFSSVEVKVKATNSMIDTRRAFSQLNINSTGASAVMINEAVGCTFRSSHSDVNGCPYQPYFGTATAAGRFEVHTSGCLYDASTNLAFVRNATGNYYTSGTATDMITSDTSSNLADWADTRTNASGGITFNYGSAPAANEVSFSNAYNSTLPNLNLYDHANNLAKEFVSDVVLPSPDLAGNSRGTSPFDAGAFELIGAVDDGDVDIVLQVTPINLY